MLHASFFTRSNEWFLPTDATRGPWDPEACHAGPPTGLLARASELAVPDQQLVRVTVEISRPVPMAGFRIETDVVRSGRSVSVTESTLIDRAGKACGTSRALHVVAAEPQRLPTLESEPIDLDALVALPFPLAAARHERPAFSGTWRRGCVRARVGQSRRPDHYVDADNPAVGRRTHVAVPASLSLG